MKAVAFFLSISALPLGLSTALLAPAAVVNYKSLAVSQSATSSPVVVITKKRASPKTALAANSSEEEGSLAESDQRLLGGVGIFAALITFYSEFTLFSSGCGLPAGPFGLVGLVEGLSYLGVTGIAAYSVVTRFKTVGTVFRFDRGSGFIEPLSPSYYLVLEGFWLAFSLRFL
jgi:hypothetical protein